MILLQLSANIGPEECCLAMRHALAYLHQEAATLGVDVAVVEAVLSEYPGNLRSV